jgi:hypothetical protein
MTLSTFRRCFADFFESLPSYLDNTLYAGSLNWFGFLQVVGLIDRGLGSIAGDAILGFSEYNVFTYWT